LFVYSERERRDIKIPFASSIMEEKDLWRWMAMKGCISRKWWIWWEGAMVGCSKSGVS
jgi:hypothetical protein